MIQVKKNSKILYATIQEIIDKNELVSTTSTIDNTRGRKENRKIEIFKSTDKIDIEWHAKMIIVIYNSGYRNDKEYSNIHYYITNMKNDSAAFFAKGIRSHWFIENKAHWVKDVIQKEDDSLIDDGSIATNLSILRNIVLNLYRANKFHSIKKATEKFCNRIVDCYKLMSNEFEFVV